MAHNQSGRIKFQRTLHHHARVDRRLADRAFEQRLTRQHLVLAVEEHHNEDLVGLGHQLQAQIIANRLRAIERRTRLSSEEPTSELQSLKRTSYAPFCLTKKNTAKQT